MSKKQFIALADTIRLNRAAFSDEAIRELARFCKSQNGAFMEGRWTAYINGECGKNEGSIK